MHAHLRALLVALPTAALISPPADAASDPGAYSGITCVPQGGSNNPNIFYRIKGVGNRGSRPETVLCSGPQISNNKMNTIRVSLIDQTPTSKDFCCSAFIFDKAGLPTASSGQSCLSGTGQQALALTVGGVGYTHIQCTIPAADPTNGPSYVASYNYTQATAF
jgi:hypothetical protein